MDTPICDFVQSYIGRQALRLHMPGHKGKAFLGVEERDITEIAGADVLYAAKGIIRRSEENAAALFGSAKTLYSAEGSSLCIRAMLYLAAMYAKANGKRPCIAAGRNAHKTFVTAAALLDLDVCWLFPKTYENLLACKITAADMEKALTGMKEKPVAVFITSPDYLGNMADIGALAEVCHKQGVLLLVDNAHGAYLRFLPQPLHPMELGADLCCDSAHKTLPVLTGGAYLHISENAPPFFCGRAQAAMSLFASTSPSYLILQSLDGVNRRLAEDYPKRLAQTAKMLSNCKRRLRAVGYTLIGDEPLKLTVAAKYFGYTGNALAQLLSAQGVECEFYDPDFVVMMFTPEIDCKEMERLVNVMAAIPRRAAIAEKPPAPAAPVKAMPPGAALFSVREQLDVHACCGRVLADAGVSCPPAVLPVVCGEQIDEAALRVLTYYGIQTCDVVAQNENK